MERVSAVHEHNECTTVNDLVYIFGKHSRTVAYLHLNMLLFNAFILVLQEWVAFTSVPDVHSLPGETLAETP